MKKYFKILFALPVVLTVWMGCSDDLPIDEDGLLITRRGQCYVSNFDLLGTDFLTVVNGGTLLIDTTEQTIAVQVAFGTDLRNLYPVFTLVTDAKLDPKIAGKTDFSDLANPKQYTVISGNRKVRKTYTINITVQP